MAKQHELLAAEKTSMAAWNVLREDTKKKFANPSHFFEGHSKSLKMIEESGANTALEAAAKDEKAVPTNVYDTLEYMFTIWARHEDLQYQKNATNRVAVAAIMWEGQEFLKDLPIDELLGLESRLQQIREVFVASPTLDATKHWVANPDMGERIHEYKFPEETTKTEKIMVPVEMSPATDKHPAQVSAVNKDVVVGKFTTMKRTGALTAVQKSDMLKRVDDFLIEIKRARMRANETEAVKETIAAKIAALLLQPLTS